MSFSDGDVAGLADALVAARRAGGAPVATPAKVPTTLEEAYRVQDAVLAKIGPAAGWKVGAATLTADPACAPILQGGVVFGDAGPVRVPARAGVEIEIGVRMGRGFRAAATPPTRAEVLVAVGSVHIVIETCARRVADKSAQAPALLLTADNIQNQGLVVGPALGQDWTEIDLANLVARMTVDGEKLGQSKGGHTSPDLVRLLVWQVGHCVTRRGGLAAGSMITTGAWTGMHMIDVVRPRHVLAEFDGLARLEITVAP